MIPKRKQPQIVLVENKVTGTIKAAHLIGSPPLGDDVWRGKVFKRYGHVEEMEDQDLVDIAKALGVTVRDRITTQDVTWFRMNKATLVYDVTGLRSAIGDERMAKRAKKKAEAGELGNRRGRKNANAGKKIYLKVEGNPRRVGTIGYKSFSLLRNGMTLEEYLAAGGRNVDLRWELSKKTVELR